MDDDTIQIYLDTKLHFYNLGQYLKCIAKGSKHDVIVAISVDTCVCSYLIYFIQMCMQYTNYNSIYYITNILQLI